MRLLKYLSHDSEELVDYRPLGYKSNDQGIDFVLNKFVGLNQTKYKIQRYFQYFTEDPDRTDLAFEIMRLAKLAKPCGVRSGSSVKYWKYL